HLIGITIIAIFHHIINAYSPIAIIVIIGLPQVAVRIHRYFIRVSEIIPEHFQMASIRVATERHTLPVRLSMIIDRNPVRIFYNLSVFVQKAVPLVTKIKIKFPVRTKGESMDTMIVLMASYTFKEHFFFIGFIITIRIRKNE